MNKITIIAATVGALCFAGSASAQVLKGPIDDSALSWETPEWGKDDRAGSANHTKNPANIKRALSTIKQFKSITIGKYYHREAPAFGPRGWQMTIPGTPTGGPFGKNALVYHDELVTTEIGQIQTQFDGPGHIGVNTSKGPVFYNGIISWRGIHDELGQALTLFRIELTWLENRMAKVLSERGAEPVVRKISQMKRMLDGTLQTVRRITTNLRPPVLDELGLRAAIEWQAEGFSRRVGIRCEVDSEPLDCTCKDTATALFRIFQEILTNVAKHAQASRVRVKLREEPNQFVMVVSDNGRGFSTVTAPKPNSFGLLGMGERAEALGGSVEISSGLAQGTTVTVCLPVRGSRAGDEGGRA